MDEGWVSPTGANRLAPSPALGSSGTPGIGSLARARHADVAQKTNLLAVALRCDEAGAPGCSPIVTPVPAGEPFRRASDRPRSRSRSGRGNTPARPPLPPATILNVGCHRHRDHVDCPRPALILSR